jgi:hypothetical protein
LERIDEEPRKLGESMKIPWERRTQLGFGGNQEKGRGIP